MLDWGKLKTIPVARLDTVDDDHVGVLADWRISTIYDLVTCFPRRYEDRRSIRDAKSLVVGEPAAVLGTFGSPRRTVSKKSGVPMVWCDLTDMSGDRIRCLWFSQEYRLRQLEAASQAIVFGVPELDNKGVLFANPTVDWGGLRSGRMVAVYPQSGVRNVTTAMVEQWVSEACDRILDRGFDDPLPNKVVEGLGLMGRAEALQQIHLPTEPETVGVARRRLAFDEVFRLLLAARLYKTEHSHSSGVTHDGSELFDKIVEGVPFSPTGAQYRVLGEIASDMMSDNPMLRLLQGDVGSGKSFVAAAALGLAAGSGNQSVLLAPTSVLAQQLFEDIKQLLDVGDDTKIVLLTNKIKVKERRQILGGLESGEIDVVVGTHSVLSDDVVFKKLGLIIVDEQHRFGVDQRSKLNRSNPDGTFPDMLVMTATPIPRTAAMTVYGELDVSRIDEMPAGRKPIETRWSNIVHDEVWVNVRSEVESGRQAFVVCPAIEGSDSLKDGSVNKASIKAVEQVAEQLSGNELSGLNVGVLHGKLKPDVRDETMRRFVDGEIDVLVATTIVEVGVNVPNATVMVIQDADRFGIAQLHQLRGRVGRGDHPGKCWLCTNIHGENEDGEPVNLSVSDLVLPRLTALVGSVDGFVLAEKDLEIRGTGTLTGTDQTGKDGFVLLDLLQDTDIIETARKAVYDLDLDRLDSELIEEIESMVGAGAAQKFGEN